MGVHRLQPVSGLCPKPIIVEFFNKMQFPKDIWDIIFRYATDMTLLDMTPIPRTPTGSITPLNFEVINGVHCTLTDLLLIHIIDAVCESNPQTIASLFINSKIAEIVNFPLSIINDFETACTLWKRRCQLYGICGLLPPTWRESLPFLIYEFMVGFDVETLHDRLEKWMGGRSDIRVSPTYPFLMLYN